VTKAETEVDAKVKPEVEAHLKAIAKAKAKADAKTTIVAHSPSVGTYSDSTSNQVLSPRSIITNVPTSYFITLDQVQSIFTGSDTCQSKKVEKYGYFPTWTNAPKHACVHHSSTQTLLTISTPTPAHPTPLTSTPSNKYPFNISNTNPNPQLTRPSTTIFPT